jgi:WD40 repeat protein
MRLELPAQAEGILAAMFPDYQGIVLRESYSSLGYSGSWVYRVHLLSGSDATELPVVVKIAAAALIEREARAYQEYVRYQWPGIAELRGRPVFPSGGELGGLCYSLMGGGVFKMQSLLQYCREADAEDVRFLLQQRLLKVMVQRMLRPARNAFEYPLRTGYDAVLPVNLLVEPSPPTPDRSSLLIAPDSLPRSSPFLGTTVRLERFVVSEIDHRQRTITLNLPPGAPGNAYRTRLRSEADLSAYTIDETMPPTEGVVVETRASRLNMEATRALGSGFDPTRETIVLGGDGDSAPVVLPNPLRAIPDILSQVRDVKVNAIHGDLNLENVLVDPQVRDVRLIDFAEARQAHVLHDFLRLETEVVTKLLSTAIGQAGLPPRAIHRFYEQLHCATFEYDGGAGGLTTDARLDVPLVALTEIRRAAREGLYDREDFSEYYQGLTIYLLAALKYANLDEVPGAKRLAFWAAATVQSLLHGESPCAKYVPSYRAGRSCPYRGLLAFEQQHASYFFGREALTQQLLARLQRALQTGEGHRLLAIIGPSGSGKSSLAQAGLIAALKQGWIQGSETWRVAALRPGSDPLESLGAALYKVGVVELRACDALREEMLHSERTLHRVTYEISPERRVIVLVDQFEEVFTLCGREALRRAFIDNLLYAAGASGGQLLVLLTLRADFYGQCIPYELATVLPAHQVLVKPMTEDGLRRAIQQPAYTAGRVFEAGLVERLLDDVCGQAGGLPLLQYALLELWNRCPGRTLTHEAYDGIGRVEGALERRAEAVYESLGSDERTICRTIMLRLVLPGEGQADSGCQASYEDLGTMVGELVVVEGVVHKLADARLLTVGGKDGERYVQVAHEALFRGWRRLRTWIDENRESLRLHRRLVQAAQEWRENDRDPSYLYWGLRLAQVEAWVAQPAGRLGGLEQSFLEASRAARDERQQEMRQAESLRLAGISKEHLNRDPELALLLAVEASRAAWTPEADSALRIALLRPRQPRLVGHDGPVTHVAWNRTGTRIATSGADAMTRVWRAENGALEATLAGHTDQVWWVAWDMAGARLATASDDGTARVWNADSGRQLGVLAGHGGWVYRASWSPDGTRIVTAGADGTARIWDAQSCAQLLALSGDVESNSPQEPRSPQLEHAVWNSEGTRILTTCADGSARVWDARTGDDLLILRHRASAPVYHAAWDPDEVRIVTASADHTACVWDAHREVALVRLTGHSGWVYHAAWSSDGTRIVTASVDGTARTWDAETGTQLALLAGHLVVRHAGWNPAGTRVVTTGDDGTARLWDAVTGQELAVLRGHSDRVRHAAWDSTGSRIATASDDGTSRVWDVDSARRPAVQISSLSAQDLVAAACQRAARNMSREEWQEHMGSEPYRETCPGKPRRDLTARV